MENAGHATTAPICMIALAWSIAAISLLAGVTQTPINAMKLFK
jgi:hypothetical protein